MSKPVFWPRRWHGGLAIVLALPFGLMAVTGFLFAQGNLLGTRNIHVNASWLPGYQGNADARPAIRAAAVEGDTWWVITRGGVLRVEGNIATPVDALAPEEVRSLIATPQGLLAIGGKGLWLEQGGEWMLILKGPIVQASGDAHTLVAILRNRGAQISQDGGDSWQPLAPRLLTALQKMTWPAGANNRISLAQLIHDLHTGSALFGERAAWIWEDMLALSLFFLCSSGIYMWWTKRR
jgi:uncharacterized iron-regulated membrane protein